MLNQIGNRQIIIPQVGHDYRLIASMLKYLGGKILSANVWNPGNFEAKIAKKYLKWVLWHLFILKRVKNIMTQMI